MQEVGTVAMNLTTNIDGGHEVERGIGQEVAIVVSTTGSIIISYHVVSLKS